MMASDGIVTCVSLASGNTISFINSVSTGGNRALRTTCEMEAVTHKQYDIPHTNIVSFYCYVSLVGDVNRDGSNQEITNCCR